MLRYAVTFKNKEGLRQLVSAQAHALYDAREPAEDWVRLLYVNTGDERVAEIYGPQAVGSFRVDPVDCWDNGDPKGIYITGGAS